MKDPNNQMKKFMDLKSEVESGKFTDEQIKKVFKEMAEVEDVEEEATSIFFFIQLIN